MTTAPSATSAQAAAKTKTPYHVLRLTKTAAGAAPGANTSPDSITASRNASYDLVRTDVQANNAEHAVRLHGEKAGDQAAGTYIAVPSRSWKAITLTVETTTTLKLEEATS